MTREIKTTGPMALPFHVKKLLGDHRGVDRTLAILKTERDAGIWDESGYPPHRPSDQELRDAIDGELERLQSHDQVGKSIRVDKTRERAVDWLSDVEDYDPQPLLIDYLEPDAHTILFGDGGTGKGVLASWWVSRLTQLGYAVLILDYEQHAVSEWKPRIGGFGGDLDRVRIFQPEQAIWTELPAIQEEIQVVRDRFPDAPTYLVVDSAAYACIGEPVEDSKTAARYSLAIAETGLPVLTLAHVTKANQDPKHPFGSIFWSNGARLTYAMSSPDKLTRQVEARKANGRPYPPTLVLDWAWAQQLPAGEVPEELITGNAPRSIGLIAREILSEMGEMRAADLLPLVNAQLLGAGREPTTLGTLSNKLGGHPGIGHGSSRGLWTTTFEEPTR